MKALILLPKELSMVSVYEKLMPIERLFGQDSLYAVISADAKHFIDAFPELVYIFNETGSLLHGIYKGLRKLRGNDVFLIDLSFEHSAEVIRQFAKARRQNLLHSINGSWQGLALLRLIDLDYVIRSLESLVDRNYLDFAQIMQSIKREYGIEYDLL
ncbi:MAG: hypothetical protein NZL90_05165 [Aquificaceae bacterium]|nr:hypothetical protein [Aquificaceae bacterium]MDW8237556.1 hypothetical protein [Aquificaceae bacterium]